MAECSGLCCAAFHLPYDLHTLEERKRTIRDGEMIAEMVIPLTVEAALERLREHGDPDPKLGGTGNYFTCLHWDERTKLCAVYEDRPAMCRDYPYRDECQHGCGLSAACAREPRTVSARDA